MQEIAIKNNIDTSNLRIFISRNTSPNAMSMGDGNFIFTISLLNRLDNEDQLKFVIAHELSHFQLKHLHKKVKDRITYLKSETYQKQKKASKSKRNKFSKSIGYIKDYHYNSKSTNRRNEFQADSLGFLLFQKVAKNKNEAIVALSKLDTLSPSEITELKLVDFKKHFSSPQLTFDDQWTNGFDFSRYNYKRGDVDLFGFHKDSLRTHPEITNRIKRLIELYPILQNQDSLAYKPIQYNKEFLMEDVYAHFCSKEYGRGIYLILQLQKSKILTEQEEHFLNHMIFLFYTEIYTAKKSLAIKKYVDEVNVVDYSDQYNLFLTIINQLRSSEIKNLINKYEN